MKKKSDNKSSYLDEFRILKTLGAGYHAQVKLAANDEGDLFAIKRYKKQTSNLSTLEHQLGIMKNLTHQNLIQLIDVRENATYKRKDETTFKCSAIILEYAGGGELFDFVAETGRFNEKVTRTYFHQLMNGLHYMHVKGFAHRDIKPENILLTKDFVLKIADFGFSTFLKGKNKSGILHTKLGTPGYMAPEVQKKNYVGTQIDIFSAGVILFIMYAGHPPFEKSDSSDPYYQLIVAKNYSLFWKAHSRKRSSNFFSESFKDLFIHMVAYQPKQRLTIEQIAEHPWVKESICSKSEIKVEFKERQALLDKIMEERREEKEKQREEKINCLQNRRTSRGGIEDHENFVEIYEEEEELNRQLNQIKNLYDNDLVLEEDPAYAIAILKEYVHKLKIKQDSQSLDDEDELKLLQITDDQNSTLVLNFQQSYQLNNEQYSSAVSLQIDMGLNNDNFVMRFNKLQGNHLDYKKIVRMIRLNYANCIA